MTRAIGAATLLLTTGYAAWKPEVVVELLGELLHYQTWDRRKKHERAMRALDNRREERDE